MAPATGTALLILGVFVLPGFVTLTFRERSHVVRRTETPFERLLHALYYSTLVYGLVLGVGWLLGLEKADLIALYRGHKPLGTDLLAGFVVGLLVPALVTEFGLIWQHSRLRPWVLRRGGVSSAHGVRSGWNAMFSREGSAMARVRLKDGSQLGGFYGKGSLAGYSEHDGDLFIIERWAMDDDGWFTEPAVGSLGLWIAADEIVSVELYETPETAESPAMGSWWRIAILAVAWARVRRAPRATAESGSAMQSADGERSREQASERETQGSGSRRTRSEGRSRDASDG